MLGYRYFVKAQIIGKKRKQNRSVTYYERAFFAQSGIVAAEIVRCENIVDKTVESVFFDDVAVNGVGVVSFLPQKQGGTGGSRAAYRIQFVRTYLFISAYLFAVVIFDCRPVAAYRVANAHHAQF